jgi:hypothetical protein
MHAFWSQVRAQALKPADNRAQTHDAAIPGCAPQTAQRAPFVKPLSGSRPVVDGIAWMSYICPAAFLYSNAAPAFNKILFQYYIHIPVFIKE